MHNVILRAITAPAELITELFADHDIDDIDELEEIQGISIKIVHGVGGGEGGGEEVDRVIKFTDIKTGEKAFVRVTGFYNSYEGTEWYPEEAEAVEPREVTVTQYFKTVT